MSIEKKTLPEEKIRLQLIEFMKNELFYPKEMITVERSISSFPHLKGIKVPNRRLDIAVFGGKQPIPLLVIECKAVNITQKAVDQVIGYNLFIKAPFIALANGKEVKTLVKSGNRYMEKKGLPDYKILLEALDEVN
jgi:hypothetical protein